MIHNQAAIMHGGGGIRRPPVAAATDAEDLQLDHRLRVLAGALAILLADPDQLVRIAVACSGSCPTALHGVVFRAAQELVGNAIRHGLYQRLVGRVDVAVLSGPHGTIVTVADDGWGLGCRPGEGQGLALVRTIIAPFGGRLSLHSGAGATVEVFLPAAVGG